jgi:hypothetical protein
MWAWLQVVSVQIRPAGSQMDHATLDIKKGASVKKLNDTILIGW